MRTSSWESMMGLLAGSDDGSSSNRSDGSVDGRFEEDSENDGLFRRSDELYFSDDSMDMPGYWGSDRRRGRRRHRRRQESEYEEDAEDEESDEEEDEEEDDESDEESDEEEEDEANEDSVEVLEPQHNVEVIELDDSSEEQPQGSSEDEYQGSSEEYKGSSEEEKEDSKAEVIELSSDEEPDRLHFTVEVKRRNIGTNNGVRVPAAFVREYIPRGTSRIKTMTLHTNLPEAGPREYTVDYKFEKHKKCRVELGHSWQRFQIVNDLEVGTRLTFILQDQKRQRYDMDIERPDNSAEI